MNENGGGGFGVLRDWSSPTRPLPHPAGGDQFPTPQRQAKKGQYTSPHPKPSLQIPCPSPPPLSPAATLTSVSQGRVLRLFPSLTTPPQSSSGLQKATCYRLRWEAGRGSRKARKRSPRVPEDARCGVPLLPPALPTVPAPHRAPSSPITTLPRMQGARYPGVQRTSGRRPGGRPERQCTPLAGEGWPAASPGAGPTHRLGCPDEQGKGQDPGPGLCLDATQPGAAGSCRALSPPPERSAPGATEVPPRGAGGRGGAGRLPLTLERRPLKSMKLCKH